MKRAAASIVATAATLYLITAYDGGPLATAADTEVGLAGGTLEGSGSANATGPANPESSQTLGAPTTTAAPPKTTSGRKTVNGTSVDTGYGDLRVSVVVDGKKVISVSGTQAHTSATSKTIGGGAIPKLQTQALSAQSADIDGVSGATYTSDGFKTSLAAALKDAGI